MSYMCGNPLLTTSRSTTEGIATVAQTIIPVSGGFVKGVLDVYVGGACLSKGDYDDSSGTQIVLAKAMALGTQYRIVCFNPAGVTGNYVAKTGDTMTGTLTMNATIMVGSQGNNYTYSLMFNGGVGNQPSLNYNYSGKTLYFANGANTQTNLAVQDNGDVSVRGLLTATGAVINGSLTVNSGALLTGALATYGSYELGNPATVQTPFIDFHSSGAGSDYDARIIASGGSAAAGQGTFSYYAAAHSFNSTVTVAQAAGVAAGLRLQAGGYAPFVRANSTNTSWEWVNSANSAVNMSLSDAGALNIPRARPTWAGLTPWDNGNRSNPVNSSTSNGITLDWSANYANQVGLKVDSTLQGFLYHSGNTVNQVPYTATHLRSGGGVDMTFNYSGQSGSPQWVWGSNDGQNILVWQPSQFSVAYAANAGTASGLAGDAGAGNLAVQNLRATSSTGQTAGRGGGSYFGWNDTGGTGEGVLTCNNAGSSGGWTIRTVNVNNSAEIGRYTISPSGTGTNGSDARLKTNIVPMLGMLDRVCQLQGVSFTYRKSGERSYGLIAQDVQPVFPDAVVPIGGGEGEEDFLGIQYAALTAPLVEAIKELSAKLDAALTRIVVLEGGHLS